MAATSSGVSIVVPTYREASNIGPLTERIFAALAETARADVELIFVDDDSRDGTEEAVATLAERFPVRLIVRVGERGLSGAVLAGFREARFDRFVVLDADLQHPPEAIPEMLTRLEAPDCDFVIATRYAGGGSVVEAWPMWRRWGSRFATLLARPLAPVSDPMSGFFALTRRTWENAAAVDQIGYKIALELFVKGGCRKAAEVPIAFGARVAGESKASMSVMLRYLHHLSRLYRFRYPRSTWITLMIVLVVLVSLVWGGSV